MSPRSPADRINGLVVAVGKKTKKHVKNPRERRKSVHQVKKRFARVYKADVSGP
jgi:hypothetical protein